MNLLPICDQVTNWEPAPPVDSEPVEAVHRIGGLLAEHACEASRQGHLTDAVINALDEQNLLRLSWPDERCGNHTLTTQAAVLAAIAGYDGSASWVAAVHTALPYMIVRFGDRAWVEVSDSDNPRAAGVFSPSGRARRVPGGWRVSGQWGWCTGQHHAGWLMVPAVPEDGGPPVAFLVPKAEFTVLGDWHYSGLAATGSNTVTLDDVAVPDYRSLLFPALLESADPGSATLASDPYYAQPFIPVLSAISAGTAYGLAGAAHATFTHTMHQRSITYTQYAVQAGAPITQSQAYTATTALFHARNHLDRLTGTVDNHTLTGRPWDTLTRARCRADLGEVIELSRRVCEIAGSACGASALRADSDLTRIGNDMRALAAHAFLLHPTATSAFSQVLCGQAVTDQFI